MRDCEAGAYSRLGWSSCPPEHHPGRTRLRDWEASASRTAATVAEPPGAPARENRNAGLGSRSDGGRTHCAPGSERQPGRTNDEVGRESHARGGPHHPFPSHDRGHQRKRTGPWCGEEELRPACAISHRQRVFLARERVPPVPTYSLSGNGHCVWGGRVAACVRTGRRQTRSCGRTGGVAGETSRPCAGEGRRGVRIDPV